MLLHLTHIHAPESCPAHDPEGMKKMAALLQTAEHSHIRVHGMYASTWEHTIYGIVEADSADDLEAWLSPALEIGEATITPVTDALATVKRLTAQV